MGIPYIFCFPHGLQRLGKPRYDFFNYGGLIAINSSKYTERLGALRALSIGVSEPKKKCHIFVGLYAPHRSPSRRIWCRGTFQTAWVTSTVAIQDEHTLLTYPY